jgi:hypothetical protein
MSQRQRRTNFSIYNFFCREPEDGGTIPHNLPVHIALPHNGVSQYPFQLQPQQLQLQFQHQLEIHCQPKVVRTPTSAPRPGLLRGSTRRLKGHAKKNSNRMCSLTECQEAYGNSNEQVKCAVYQTSTLHRGVYRPRA